MKFNNALSKDDIGVKTTVCDIKRVIKKQITGNTVDRPLNTFEQSDIEPCYVVREVNKLLMELRAKRANETKLFRVLLRQLLSSKTVVSTLHLKRSQFDQIIIDIRQRVHKSACQAGEPCGPLASHSISEPAT